MKRILSMLVDGNGEHRFRIVLGSVIGVFLLGLMLVLYYTHQESQRELRNWQIRLELIADMHSDDLTQWVEQQYESLNELAENTSLQLYMTELSMSEGDSSQVTDEAAQATYLRNLLMAAAEKYGFAPEVSYASKINANIKRVSPAGLVLLDNNKRPVISTPELPPLEGALAFFVENAERGERALRGPYRDSNGNLVMAFLMPIYALQEEEQANKQIGMVVGIREVSDSLFSLLQYPGQSSETAESILVRISGNTISYISPLRDGTPALTRKREHDIEMLAGYQAAQKPGSFQQARDYLFHEVLATAREIPGTDWVLVRKVNRDEAMAEADARQLWFVLLYVLFGALFAATLVALWRHATSQQAQEAAQRYRQLASSYKSQEELLELVTDSQTSGILIIDQNETLRFANKVSADKSGINKQDMLGRSLPAVMDKEQAEEYLAASKEAHDGGRIVTIIHHESGEVEERIIQSRHIPLKQLPLPETREELSGVLIVEQDITEAMNERAKRERVLQQLVDTLVTLVDRRDPFSANHSANVARVARETAQEMELDPVMVETAEIAGKLMNLGKIIIPAEVLTHKGKISDKDIRHIREAVYTSADMLEGVEFNGPVVKTLRQCQEHWDGSGPHHLKGEDILPAARVVAVANAFVGMVSPRAYRANMSLDETLENLMGEVGTLYDRRVVAALVNYIDNRGGREEWSRILEKVTAIGTA